MKKIIAISIIIIAFIAGSGVYIYLTAFAPIKNAEEEAVKKAMKHTDLQKVEDFYLYNGEETTYIIEGKDKKGTNIYVWVPEKKGKIIVKKQADGITKKEAVKRLLEERKPKKIIAVRLGMEKNIPLWEIYYHSEGDLINYYYVDFKTGNWLKKIENL